MKLRDRLKSAYRKALYDPDVLYRQAKVWDIAEEYFLELRWLESK
jgi:hypothetical protein